MLKYLAMQFIMLIKKVLKLTKFFKLHNSTLFMAKNKKEHLDKISRIKNAYIPDGESLDVFL